MSAKGFVLSGPVASSGISWWNINYDTGVDGWSAELYLQKVATPSSSTKFVTGNRVRTTDKLNVRATAGGTLLGTKTLGALGTVASGPVYFAGSFWWQINYDTDPDGWSVENYLEKAVP